MLDISSCIYWPFISFLWWRVCYITLNHKSSLYILNGSSLSDRCVVNVFYQCCICSLFPYWCLIKEQKF